MTTSGTTILQYTRDQLIAAAIRKLGATAQGQTPSTEDYTNGAMALNTCVAMLRAIGMPIWKRTTYSFVPTTSPYTIGIGYTINVPAPLKVYQAYRIDSGGYSKIPMEVIANTNFNMLPTTPGGAPIKLNYDSKLNFGYINLWPVPDSTNTATVYFVYQGPFEYFSSSGDTADFPEEWYNALIYKTAVLLAPEWGIPLQDRTQLKQEAQEYIDTATPVSQEDGSFFISPERDRW